MNRLSAVAVQTIAVAFLAGAVASPGQTVQPQSSEVSARTQDSRPGDSHAVSAEGGGSQVRIVRLSVVRGAVQLDRNTGHGFEGAFANIPVITGAQLRTAQGVAEIEFEDNSTLRVAPESEVRFDELTRMSSGETVSSVSVRKGMAYASLARTKGNVFILTDDRTKISLFPGTHVRLNAAGPQAHLAVFDGSARVEAPSGVSVVSKRQSLVFDPSGEATSELARATEEQPLDEWDKRETSFHKQTAAFVGSGANALYGANDLGYYGQFVSMPGCGSMWRPYFASAAWDPFANGVWAWYSGAGYSWVSPYPWGWLPFHSGTWAMCGTGGWGWRPGGQWYGLHNVALQKIANYPSPLPIPPAPIKGSATLIPVNVKPLAISGPSGSERFVFRQDSAGLGVPRETFGRLKSTASEVQRSGVVSTTTASSSTGPSTGNALGVPSPSRMSGPAPSRSPMPTSSMSSAHSSPVGSAGGSAGASSHK